MRWKSKLGYSTATAALAAVVSACGDGTNPSSLERVASDRATLVAPPRGVDLKGAASGVQPSTALPGAHLTYYGGRVVSNAQVVQVLYGAGTYASFVSSTASPSVATFFGGYLNSPYVDWLSEYNTPAVGGTNQTIGRGTFAGQFTITPSPANDGSTISDASIQAELVAQINAGNLPSPTADAAGNNNTIYAIYFPLGKVISNSNGFDSCGGFMTFCAYHSTIAAASGPGGHEIYYLIIPDEEPGSGCDTGCGSGTPFANETSVSSHELVEAITNPEVALAPTVGPPFAWWDAPPINGEIGDLCAHQQANIVGGDGVFYVAQKEFSNVADDCIIGRTLSTFKISATPLSRTGETCTGSVNLPFTVTATLTSGTVGDAVSFSTTGMPAGSVTFSPSVISSNGGTTTAVFHMPPGGTASVPFTLTGNGGYSTASDAASTITYYPPNTCAHPPCRCQPGFQYCSGQCIPTGACCTATDPRVTVNLAQ